MSFLLFGPSWYWGKQQKNYKFWQKHVYRLQLLTDNVAIIGILRALVLSADRKPETDF